MHFDTSILKERRRQIADFGKFMASHIQIDNILRVASSLSYTSLIAIVPLFAIGLAIFSAFPVFSDIRAQVQEALIQNVVPATGREVSEYFNEFVSATAKLTTVGVIGIAVTAILLLSTIENSFNYIFRVYKPRSIKTKITLYWTIITLGPLLLGVGISLKGYFYTLQKFVPDEIGGDYFLQAALPALFTLLTLMLVYILVPNKKIKITHAFLGALAAQTGFYIMRKFFGSFIASSVTYTTLYGAMAAVPLLLVWLYLNWAVVIFGAALTAAIGEYKDTRTVENTAKTETKSDSGKKVAKPRKKSLQKEHK